MSKPTPFPHRHEVHLADGQLSAPPRSRITVGPPPQFGGRDVDWSPEELLTGAALTCLWTTFEAYARREALSVRSWSGSAVGTLDRSPSGPVFTSIALSVAVTVAPTDEERARRILAHAEDHCIVRRALNAPVTLQVTVTTVAD